MNTNEKQMQLRAFNPDDAETILSWCKDKHAFRLWSADRYKDFPALPEEMMEQYKGDNMYPLTAVVTGQGLWQANATPRHRLCEARTGCSEDYLRGVR